MLISRIGVHDNMLKIRPPMPFSRENADLLLATLDDVLRRREDAVSGFYELNPAQQGERVAELARAALAEWGIEARELDAAQVSRERCVSRRRRRRPALRDPRAPRRLPQRCGAASPNCSGCTRCRGRLRRAGARAGGRGQLFESSRMPTSPSPARWTCSSGSTAGRSAASRAVSKATSRALARTFHTIGALAARLHNQAARWRPPPGFTRHAWDTEGLVGEQPFWGRFWELAALSASERELMIRARDRVRRELSGLERTPRNYGLIHADFAPENLMVDGSRVRLLDFDDAGYGWHLFEIATSLYFHIGQPYFEAIERATLAGYRTERELTAADRPCCRFSTPRAASPTSAGCTRGRRRKPRAS